jgi:hypothetical protein
MNNEMNNNVPVNNVPVNNAPVNDTTGRTIVLILILLVIVGVVVYFVFFGKGTQIIVCKKSSMIAEMEMEITLKNGHYYSGVLKESIDLSSYSEENFNSVKEMDFCKDLNAASSILYSFDNCKQDVIDRKINVTVDLVLKINNQKIGNAEDVANQLKTAGYDECYVK